MKTYIGTHVGTYYFYFVGTKIGVWIRGGNRARAPAAQRYENIFFLIKIIGGMIGYKNIVIIEG